MIPRLFIATTALSTCLVLPVMADDAPSDAQAQALMTKVTTFYKTLPGVTFNNITRMSADDMPEPMVQTVAVTIAKPNMFSIRSSADAMSSDVICNGTSIITAIPEFEIYHESPAPKTFSEIAKQANEGEGPLSMSDPMMPMILELFAADPDKTFLGDAKNMAMAESKEFDGVQTDAVSFNISNQVLGDMKMNAYFAQGDEPWLTAVIPDLSEFQEEGAPKFEVILMMKDWKPGSPANTNFAFEPADSWTKVDDLMASIIEKQQEQMGNMEFPEAEGGGPPHKLVGTQAKDFELPLLRGDKKVKLSDLKGKVVVLDFWATWCGPCIMGLPHVVEAVEAFKDRGVVFYAIDENEPAEKVKAFVDRKNWKFAVLLDEKGTVGDAYGVQGIPHTVIIGPEGKILNVHIGFLGPKTTKKKLTEEIEAALAAEAKG